MPPAYGLRGCGVLRDSHWHLIHSSSRGCAVKTSTHVVRPLLAAAFLGAAALLVSPLHVSPSGSLAYQMAEAGNGNGKGNGNGNGKGNSGGNAGNANSGNSGSKGLGNNKLGIVLATSDQGAEASSLGRWNAARPFSHPVIQAHIRNGNFTGTIGLMARYIVAQNALNDMQANPEFSLKLAEAQAIVDLEAADPAQTTFSDEQIAAAQALIDSYDSAVSGLAKAETLMARYSNRAPWEEIRDVVRLKLGLDPAENDLL
jgi:hypothetical protein